MNIFKNSVEAAIKVGTFSDLQYFGVLTAFTMA